MKIAIEIQRCNQGCPHFKITGTSSTDGWDRGEDWYCNKAQREISNFIEWHDKIEIPKWCPIKLKN